MLLDTLELKNFRNYENAKFRFGSDRVVFTGPNGTGKTNLLEAIYFLSILRSFRTVSGREIVRIGARGFELAGEIERSEVRERLRIVQHGSGRRETFIEPNRVRRSSEFIREFRAVAFVPEDRNIPGGSSSFRRRFFDMLISTLNPAYLTALGNYSRALAQRNRSLKAPARAEIVAAFEPELAQAMPLIAAERRNYAGKMEEEVNRLLGFGATPMPEFRIRLIADYPEEASACLAALQAGRSRDLLRGCTGIGPQLDEFEFTLGGKVVRNYASTGQIRLLALLLRMAEFHLVRRGCGERVAVLVDDVTGELDAKNRERFFEVISNADQQFFTFTRYPAFFTPGEVEEIDLAMKGES